MTLSHANTKSAVSCSYCKNFLPTSEGITAAEGARIHDARGKLDLSRLGTGDGAASRQVFFLVEAQKHNTKTVNITLIDRVEKGLKSIDITCAGSFDEE
nr:hypothetical protein Iba_chr14bCG14540 [Ipomoea batatas]